MSGKIIKNYEEAVEYIEEIPKFTAKTDLAHTERLLKELGDPQSRIPHFIHVAGTNGKGSVCSFLDSALRACGFRCGLFTSPHLVTINERMQIDREPVSDDLFLKAFRRVMDAAEARMAAGDVHPTYFETLFLMSIVIFAESGIDWCILETGMGGRLDQTNVIRKPDITVITSIGLDHTEYLGDTIEAIASEKAGIIKPGVPVVYDADEHSGLRAAGVIRSRAEQLGCRSYRIGEQNCILREQTGNGISFCLRGVSCESDCGDALQVNSGVGVPAERAADADPEACILHVQSAAAYQMRNAALAYTALQVLYARMPELFHARLQVQSAGGLSVRSSGAKTRTDLKQSVVENKLEQSVGVVTDYWQEAVCRGIAEASWPCRMEQIAEGVILDGAHNEPGIREFIRTAQQFHKTQPVTLLFSAVSDKDFPEMIRDLAENIRPEHVVTTSVSGSRGVEASVFADAFAAWGCRDVAAADDVAEAYRIALEKKGDGVLFCVGSLYLMGEIRALNK